MSFYAIGLSRRFCSSGSISLSSVAPTGLIHHVLSNVVLKLASNCVDTCSFVPWLDSCYAIAPHVASLLRINISKFLSPALQARFVKSFAGLQLQTIALRFICVLDFDSSRAIEKSTQFTSLRAAGHLLTRFTQNCCLIGIISYSVRFGKGPALLLFRPWLRVWLVFFALDLGGRRSAWCEAAQWKTN